MKGSDILANPNTIPYLHYQDIQIPDVVTRTQFKQYWNSSQYSQAINLLIGAGLSGKAYLAEVINTLTNGVLYLENLYDTNVTSFLASALNHYDFLIDSFTNRYVWNQAVTYVLFNFVTYNNETYMALGDVPVGTLPTDTTYWLHVSIRGEAGAEGLDLTLRYDWDNAVTYVVNDVVSYNNKLYVAIQPNVNVAPDTDTTMWMLLIDFDLGKIVVSLTAPENPNDDDVWLQPTSAPTVATPTTAVFKRWDEPTQAWIDMYPFTVKAQVADVDTIAPSLEVVYYDILTSEWYHQGSWGTLEAEGTTWQSLQSQNINWAYFENAKIVFVYPSSKVQADSIIKILPQVNMTQAQKQAYMLLSVEGDIGEVILSSPSYPTVNLPIVILIQ